MITKLWWKPTCNAELKLLPTNGSIAVVVSLLEPLFNLIKIVWRIIYKITAQSKKIMIISLEQITRISPNTLPQKWHCIFAVMYLILEAINYYYYYITSSTPKRSLINLQAFFASLKKHTFVCGLQRLWSIFFFFYLKEKYKKRKQWHLLLKGGREDYFNFLFVQNH